MLGILPVSTDGYEQAKYFLCPYMPYPKKTNMMEIWSLQIQAIVACVCVCVCLCLSLCLPGLFSKHLMHTETAVAKFIIMQSEKKPKKNRVDVE